MHFLDNLKNSRFCSHTLSGRRPLVSPRAPDPVPVKILPDPGWFLNLGHKPSDTKRMKTKESF